MNVKTNSHHSLLTKMPLILFILLTFVSSFVYADDVPPEINYQGYITSGGNAYSGTGYFKFKLVNSAGTTTYWSNDGTHEGVDSNPPDAAISITVSSGVFNTILGDTDISNMTALHKTDFSNGIRLYLRVWFSTTALGTYEQISPDKELTASAYAINCDAFDNTTQTSLTLDSDNTAAGADVQIIAEQGSDNNGILKYNATDNKWQYSNDGGAFNDFASGTGTVTSVGLSLPGEFTISNSPVVGAGTLTGTWADKAKNIVFAGPASGVDATPAFRALVSDDIPWTIPGTIGSGTPNTGAFTTVSATGNVSIDNQSDLLLYEADAGGSNYTGFQAPAALGDNYLYTLPSDDGTQNQYLQTNGSGTLTWATMDTLGLATTTLNNVNSTAVAASLIPSSDSDKDLGSDTLNWEDIYLDGVIYNNSNLFIHNYGTENFFAGVGAGNLTNTGTKNIGIGYQAFPGITTGSSNIAIGYRTLYEHTSSSNCIAIGTEAVVAYNGTSPVSNIGIGHYAGNAWYGSRSTFLGYRCGNIGGSPATENTAVGYYAMEGVGYGNGANNTAVGAYSFFSHVDGESNTMIGHSAGAYTSSGSSNTFIGLRAGYTNTTGNNNIFLGYKAGYNEAGSNKLYIENSDSTTPLIYGDFSSNYVMIYGQGAAKSNLDIFQLTNTINAVDMDGTTTSILFNQYYYDAATPAVADAGKITVGTETDWTSTASTQDGYIALSSVDGGTVTERMRIASSGLVSFKQTGTIDMFTYDGEVADEGTVTLPDAVSQFLWVDFDNGVDFALCSINSVGTVTLIANSANVDDADTDNTYCVYDGGTGAIVKNRIGSAKNVKIVSYN